MGCAASIRGDIQKGVAGVVFLYKIFFRRWVLVQGSRAHMEWGQVGLVGI